MREVTATGHSVEAAVESALAQLKTTKNQAEIIVVDKGKKGFLGIWARSATVTVRKLETPLESAEQFLQDICFQMGVKASIMAKKSGRNIFFELKGDNIAILIGKRGQTLNSLQYLTQLVINKNSNEYLRVTLDAEGYRERRKQSLIQLAERTAHKALKLGKEISLEPMSSNERKIIHNALTGIKSISTYSSGEDAFRHIIISPEKKSEQNARK